MDDQVKDNLQTHLNSKFKHKLIVPYKISLRMVSLYLHTSYIVRIKYICVYIIKY